ncbi:hypothetical protein [Burkholderia thailandensis]|uniref:hypothetical protein n=1 Tax=Burkholderia thailandensis TaxID=57975 RepID=UPI00107EA6A9|nr:hypothetical protein [Burkholderia thailandensis]MCS3393737.1 hypothetical protein [Burkholderia thailandensis]MCS6454737.1 hypothetical protein [Burkholderia thailandensis]MCS6482790.1 hypothetical protein [Burkholderia thailandensis]MCS6489813.1 hypothetical protein [Burkholderia thailandensis]MCZ2894976.1 hypothetical protein [Burkholderia thailandensis]
MSDARMPPLNSGYFVDFGQGAMCADIRIRLTDRRWIGGGLAVRWRRRRRRMKIARRDDVV